MKKLIVTILTFVYITSATGATIHLHYCMGKLVEWSFWKNKSEKCDNCGMDKADAGYGNCCKDDHKQLKLDKDQKITEANFKWLQSTFCTTVYIPFYRIHNVDFVFIQEKNQYSQAPPPCISVAVCIRNCTFLI